MTLAIKHSDSSQESALLLGFDHEKCSEHGSNGFNELGDGATDSLTSVIDQIFVIMNKTVK